LDIGFLTFSTVTQTILTHPFSVFHNQCQVNHKASLTYHLLPWSPVMPMYNIYKNQVK